MSAGTNQTDSDSDDHPACRGAQLLLIGCLAAIAMVTPIFSPTSGLRVLQRVVYSAPAPADTSPTSDTTSFATNSASPPPCFCCRCTSRAPRADSTTRCSQPPDSAINAGSVQAGTRLRH